MASQLVARDLNITVMIPRLSIAMIGELLPRSFHEKYRHVFDFAFAVAFGLCPGLSIYMTFAAKCNHQPMVYILAGIIVSYMSLLYLMYRAMDHREKLYDQAAAAVATEVRLKDSNLFNRCVDLRNPPPILLPRSSSPFLSPLPESSASCLLKSGGIKSSREISSSWLTLSHLWAWLVLCLTKTLKEPTRRF